MSDCHRCGHREKDHAPPCLAMVGWKVCGCPRLAWCNRPDALDVERLARAIRSVYAERWQVAAIMDVDADAQRIAAEYAAIRGTEE